LPELPWDFLLVLALAVVDVEVVEVVVEVDAAGIAPMLFFWHGI
jgi:hypothetical protein